jgi:hypothetical protein
MRNRNWALSLAAVFALLLCLAGTSAQTEDHKGSKPKGAKAPFLRPHTKATNMNGTSNGGTSNVQAFRSTDNVGFGDRNHAGFVESSSQPELRSRSSRPASKLGAANDNTYLTIDLDLSPFSLTPASVVNQLLSIGLHNIAASSPGPPGVALQSSPAFSMADVTGNGTLGFTEAGENNLQIFTLNSTLSSDTVQTFLAGDTIVGVAFADFNGDGKPDLAATYSNNNTGIGGLAILLNNGSGAFANPMTYGNYSGNFTVLDVNHDGNLDIVSADGEVWLGNGHGAFNRTAAYGPTGANVIAAADFNGDGIPDLAVGGSIGILLGNGDGTFRHGQPLPPRRQHP